MKLRERIAICCCITFFILSVLLVIDLQFDFGYYSKNQFLIPSRHGRVDFDEMGGTDDVKSVYRKFRDRFGFYAPVVAPEETVGAATDQGSPARPTNQSLPLTEPHDSFADLLPFAFPVERINRAFLKSSAVVIVDDTRGGPSLEDVANVTFDGTLQSLFHKRISKREMYRENDEVTEKVLKKMQNDKIVLAKEKEGGTQLKLIIQYESGDRALFKPMRFPREQQTLANHFYFTDYERHNAEIAAFHLDRILGFRRAMPVTGRTLNLTTEFYNVAEANLLKTFFVSPANNYCFHGHCSYYCDTSHAVCGNPDMLEGSFAAFLPEKDVIDRTLRKHPWRRSYHKRRKAVWETDPNYCEAVKISPPYNEGGILLDLIDTCIFDFLMGNMDRHHFEMFSVFGNDSFPLHLDHGRAFGKPFHDELSILAPLTQCCMIKHTTLATLLRLHNGSKKLSDLMRESTSKDPIAPILWEPHFPAMDRRVKITLEVVRSCIEKTMSTPQSEPPPSTAENKNE